MSPLSPPGQKRDQGKEGNVYTPQMSSSLSPS